MSKLSLNDVAPRIVSIHIESVDGWAQDVDIKMPTLTEWNEAIVGIVFPDVADYKKVVPNAANGKKESEINYNHPEYVKKRGEAIEELSLRRVTQALLGAGNFPELADSPLEIATQILREKADKSILDGVYEALEKLIKGTKGGVEAKKASFRPEFEPVGSNGNLPSDEMVKAVLG